jgi:hypothetical protein
VQQTDTAELALDVAVLEVARAKQNLVEAEAELAKAQENLIAHLTSVGHKSREYGGFRATLVKSETVKVNEAGLKKAIGARVFNKLTKAVLDKKKLEEAVEAGAIDPVILAQNSQVVEGKPFIRLTETKQ